MTLELVAEHLRGTAWVVRPKGCTGMAGWIDGKAWSAHFVQARSSVEAITKSLDSNHFKGVL